MALRRTKINQFTTGLTVVPTKNSPQLTGLTGPKNIVGLRGTEGYKTVLSMCQYLVFRLLYFSPSQFPRCDS